MRGMKGRGGEGGDASAHAGAGAGVAVPPPVPPAAWEAMRSLLTTAVLSGAWIQIEAGIWHFVLHM